MSKLVYPSNGIYRYCRDDIESCLSSLSSAVNNSNLDVPGGFTYKSYLRQLDDVLSGYYKNFKILNSKLEKIDNYYENLDLDLAADVKKMSVTKIKDRDRMII